jgi:hypothetical protein
MTDFCAICGTRISESSGGGWVDASGHYGTNVASPHFHRPERGAL